MLRNITYKIRDVEFTIYDDGDIGVELKGPYDLLTLDDYKGLVYTADIYMKEVNGTD